MSRARIRIVIELDPEAEPITGVLRPPAEEPQAFTGWIELTQMLEAIRGARA